MFTIYNTYYIDSCQIMTCDSAYAGTKDVVYTSMSQLEDSCTAPCTAPCTLTLPRLSCIAPGHCGTPRRSVLRIQPPTLQIPVRHHLRTLRWCDCEGGGQVASISTITTTTTPPCAISPPVTLAARTDHHHLLTTVSRVWCFDDCNITSILFYEHQC